jgi:L-fuconate dehydratase
MTTIRSAVTNDFRVPLAAGEGVDAVHGNPVYSYALTLLASDTAHVGIGGAFTLGAGNDLVCELAHELARSLVGYEIEGLMAKWGNVSRQLANHPQLRWLGPHKGAIHLALASVTNACFDLWAKHRGVPLWKLLLDLSPDQVVALLDLSYIEDVLSPTDAKAILQEEFVGRVRRESVLITGYPGYDTSVGWFNYDDAKIVENAKKSMASGFSAMKLKVGSKDLTRDIKRLKLIRDAVGPGATLMVDANQQWAWPMAEQACREFGKMGVYWIEEPTHPDDVLGHQRLARIAGPVKIAAGEHVPNRVVFKNYMEADAAQIIQVDAVRVAGVSEFIAVSLMARKFKLDVIPHVGDMGQLHQHLVLFNHIAVGLPCRFLEHIPHLAGHFVHPVQIKAGRYVTPQAPGSSFDLHGVSVG